jgi:hypothetical protein
MVALDHSGGDPEPLQGGVAGRGLPLPHYDLVFQPSAVGWRDDERGDFVALPMDCIPEVIGLGERNMDGEFVLDGYRSLQIEGEDRLYRTSEVERYPTALDHPADGIGPFGLDQTMPGHRRLEPVGDVHRPGAFH